MGFLGRNFYMGRLLGIRLYVHISLFIYLAITLVLNLGGDPISAMVFYLILIGSVLMHEYAHALTARAFGAQTDKIILHIFGGFAMVGSIFGNVKNLIMILAGPASNLVLAAILGVIYQHVGGGHWLRQCFTINIALGIFNLIPAYPMDGGRALLILLKMTSLMTRTITQIVFWATTGSCLTMVMYFGAGNINVILIAIMVWVMMYSQYRTGHFS